MKNSQRIEELYRVNKQELDRFVLSKTHNREVANDILQDVFVKLLSGVELTKIKSPKSFLFRMVSNLTIDYWRKDKKNQKNIPVEEVAYLTDKAPSLDQVLSGKQEFESFCKILKNLPVKSQHILMLNKIEGLSCREIAIKLEMSDAAVEKRVIRSLAYCRDQLYGTKGKKA